MVKFLIHRPIAVSMTLIAILVVGVVSMSQLPVSLMPDTDIPEITVQVGRENASARELENTVVKSLRRQLMQVSHLADIRGETRDEQAVISLQLEYGTDINLAFIEVNEMIDRAMGSFPREVERPRVIKASATDIPVFYLNLTLKEAEALSSGSPAHLTQLEKSPQRSDDIENLFPVPVKFTELSRFASGVIRRRLEQLPEVTMVDISGQVFSELLIMPDMQELDALGITLEQLENTIRNSNIDLGNLLIRDGQYQYNVQFNTTLRNKRDIENIYLKTQGRLLQLKNLAQVIEHPQKQKGLVTADDKYALTLAIIKQSSARMSDLKNSLNREIGRMQRTYPDIDFTITRDQTRLLDYSIANLEQSLIWGALLAFLVMFFFLRDIKAPLLIGITIPVSLVISLLFFYFIGISINIISLSGLVLGVGMMVDNSIIVIDNITQHRDRKLALDDACIVGVNEIFRPMLSSVLTTCAVFIPLIFVGGITGALFYDQAMAVTIGLFVSLGVAVTVLPVYYRIFYRKRSQSYLVKRVFNILSLHPPQERDTDGRLTKQHRKRKGIWPMKTNELRYEALYEKGFRLVMRRQVFSWILFLAFFGGVFLLFESLSKTRLPHITKDEVLLRLDWNEKIHVYENRQRTGVLLAGLDSLLLQHTCWIGEQQFLLNKEAAMGSAESLVYLKAREASALQNLQQQIIMKLNRDYPNALFGFEDAGNIFNMVFRDDEPALIARLRAKDDYGPRYNEVLQSSLAALQNTTIPVMPVSWQEHTVLMADPVKLLAYNIPVDRLFGKLRSAFNEREALVITDNQNFVPVILGGQPQLISDILRNLYVNNNEGKAYPVRDLIRLNRDYDLKTITAGQEGEYYPVALDIKEGDLQQTTSDIRQALEQDNLMEATFSGSILSNRELMQRLLVILAISLALLYFILASQFESLVLPLIVLLEIPIGIFGAFLCLKIFGSSINIMSMIGIVVMTGIVINDSILKIDTINQLRQKGYGLLRALLVAGQRRLKPILMTSLTTILALVPLLFTTGLGAELQLPLALAVIGSMTISNSA